MKRFRDTEYFITENGDVFRNGKKLKPQKSRDYLQIKIHPENKWYKVHRLVAELYIPNPDDKSQVNHLNKVKTDNRVENLEWVTASENQKHSYLNGCKKQIGQSNHNSKLTPKDIIFIRANYIPRHKELGQSGLAKKYGINQSTIYRIIHHDYWKHIHQ